MLKIKSQNINLLTYIILFFCLVSLSTDLILTNKNVYSIVSQSICFVRRVFSKLPWSFADHKVFRT